MEGSFAAAHSKFGSQLSESGALQCRMLYCMFFFCFGNFLQQQWNIGALFQPQSCFQTVERFENCLNVKFVEKKCNGHERKEHG